MKTISIEKVMTGEALAWFKQYSKNMDPQTWKLFSESGGWPVPNMPVGASVIICKGKPPKIVIPVEADEQTALNAAGAFLQCMEVFPKNDFSGSEIFSLCETGRKAVAGHELKFPDTPDADLRDFIFGYCSGTILTSRTIPSDLINMVFLPLAFGALSFSPEVEKILSEKLPPDPGEKLELQPKPTYPTLKPLPQMIGSKPEPIKPDPNRLAELKSLVSWQKATQDDINALIAEARRNNKKQKEAWTKKRVEHKLQKRLIEEENAAALAEYEKAIVQWESDKRPIQDQIREWDKASARYHITWNAALQERNRDLGVLWEYLSAGGSRSLNGFPMFFSMRILNVTDWNKARKAILKEQKRREKVKLV